MLNIPSCIRIGFVDYIVNQFSAKASSNEMGTHNGKLCRIELESTMNERIKFKTFVHECIHAVIDQYSVNIPDENIEEVTGQLETGVSEVIEQLVVFETSVVSDSLLKKIKDLEQEVRDKEEEMERMKQEIERMEQKAK